MSRYPELLQAVKSFIAKADDDLERLLDSEGFIDPSATVEDINALESELASALEEQRDFLLDGISGEDDIEHILDAVLPTLFVWDATAEVVRDIYRANVEQFLRDRTQSYIASVDSELAFSTFSNRTVDWIEQWSERLGTLMNLTSHDRMLTILSRGLEDGSSIDRISESLQDAYAFSEMRARRTAITEVLTAQSYARQEAIIQSPSVDRKEWRHTGSHNNTPRPHHQDMDGQIVGKSEKFVINSPSGKYECDFPRDTSLPASERVNCHCIHRGIVNDDVMGMSLEERKQLQQKAIDDDNESWEAELSEKNKAQADIDEDTISLDWLKAKSKEDQIKYWGGVKSKWALIESGVVSDDDGLGKMFKTVSTTRDGKKISRSVPKTLDELAEDGIITIKHTALQHASSGEYKPASKQYPNGRMVSGGHGTDAKNLCDSKGIAFEVTGTFSNGVTVGNVPSSKLKSKQSASGQAWFPDRWDADEILVAGTAVANSSAELIDGRYKTDVWDGVAVRTIFDESGNVSTICPDYDQDLYVEGVELT